MEVADGSRILADATITTAMQVDRTGVITVLTTTEMQAHRTGVTIGVTMPMHKISAILEAADPILGAVIIRNATNKTAIPHEQF
jgi:hypothetical protein